jgi:hypothetical protein
MGFIWAEFMAYAREAVATLKYIRGLNLAVIDALETKGLTIKAVSDSSTDV